MSFILNYLIEIIFIVIGIGSIYLGITDYQLWLKNVPQGGFMPVIAGGLLTLISLLVIFDKKCIKKIKLNSQAFMPVAAILIALIINIFVGVLPAITLMVFLWLKSIEKYSLKSSILITLITVAVTYGIFWVWLKVPFPTGLLNIKF